MMMMPAPVQEVYRLVTADGVSFALTGNIYLLQHRNFGAPNVNYETRQGFRQDGETVLDKRLRPQRIVLEIRGQTTASRAGWWELRSNLLNIVRPNRRGALRLDVIRKDGVRRSINLFYDSGLDLPWDTDTNDFGVSSRITFIAHTPLWYATNATVFTPAAAQDDNLVFPITFPIRFGSSGAVFNTGTINYAGTWETFPIITVEGSYNTLQIRNDALNGSISLNVPTALGDTRIIDTDPTNLRIEDGNGNDVSDELTVTSTLVDFSIKPESELDPNASPQRIIVTTFGGAGTPTVTIEYNERYFGI